MTEEMQLFLEDMDEQLSIMEATLLDIQDIPLEDIDKEMINKVFRAMHTMKGNAGIFGYKTIVSFAHVAENLLDEIRNGKIELTQDMINLFLQVKDESKTIINLCTNNKKLDEEQEKHYNYLLNRLSDFLPLDTQNSDSTVQLIENTTNIQSNDQLVSYIIDLKLKKDFYKSGMDVLSIIKYLELIGNLKNIKLLDDEIPTIEDIDPLNAYMKFIIEYETSEPINEITEAFEFVREDIELDIFEAAVEKDIEESFLVFKKAKQTKQNFTDTNNEPAANNTSAKNLSLRVGSIKVDKLINQISEMVIANAKIMQYAKETQDSDFEETVIVMSEMLEEVRNGIMDIRMVQVGDSFSKLRRIVTDIAKRTGKEIKFEIVGGETELDKTVIEKLSDPLVHMLRNAVDHGIETPDIRVKNGKNSKGTVTLKAYPEAGTIVIKIIDDGKGIDKDIIFNKAVEKNLIEKDANLSDSEIYNLLFLPGFSTANEVTDISGRGVGMDVVKKNIEDLRGTVFIESTLKKGTTFTIRLPLTLAIIDGFLVQVADSKYIIPLDNIRECVELTSDSKNQLKNNGYITLRTDILPILDVAEFFKIEKMDTKRENIVVVKYGTSQVGLRVDELIGEFQTVIKPLGEIFENIAGISGGTILGNGEIAFILDIQRLIEYKIKNKESKNGK
jgi:two-component system chemotaxis sensor kinase CheA